VNEQRYFMGVTPKNSRVYLRGTIALGSPILRDIVTLANIPGVDLNFSGVYCTDGYGLEKVKQAIAEAYRKGNHPTVSGLAHNLILMWALLLIAEPSDTWEPTDTAYKA
jgi:hypothetical protein